MRRLILYYDLKDRQICLSFCYVFDICALILYNKGIKLRGML